LLKGLSAMADDQIEHLLRRAGFGASADEIGVYNTMPIGAAVDRLANYERVPDDVDAKIGLAGYVGTTSNGRFSPNTVVNDARQRWLFRMLHTNRPLQEKMTLFWHNYFATGYTKVAGAVGPDDGTRLMAARAIEDPQGQQGQIELLRGNALGYMRDLLVAVAQDPAMLIWLDGNTNTKLRPQENFGRELMELFTRGVGFYTESDVYAAARVFTGWNLQITRGIPTIANPLGTSYKFIYRPENHETAEKTFSFPIYADGGSTIPSRAASGGMQDGLDLINALAAHPETARRLVTKLYGFFVNETATTPSSSTIDQAATVYRQSGGNIRAVVQSLLLSAEFADSSSYHTRYSWPAEYVVRSLKETGWTGFSLGTTLTPLVNMGQQLFEPPDVAGWTLGQGWFSTGMMLARMNFASTLSSNQKFRLATAAASAKQSPQALVNYMLTRMTPASIDSMYSDLVVYASSGAAWTGSDAQMQTKASGLAHLILGSAEYQFL
jgi:uncharacterized protein (DUF1800 family)